MTNDAVNAILQEVYVVETPECSWCGKSGTVEMTFQEFMNLEHGQGLIQDRLPNHSPAIREQLKTGYHPECWTTMFGTH
jgi:hypothetical protein